jgi:hypothetical protein
MSVWRDVGPPSVTMLTVRAQPDGLVVPPPRRLSWVCRCARPSSGLLIVRRGALAPRTTALSTPTSSRPVGRAQVLLQYRQPIGDQLPHRLRVRGCPVKTQPHIGPRYKSVYFKSPLPRPQLNPVLYKGFTITARTFQVHGSGRWTLDLLIGRNTDLRAFSGPSTYPTEESAITGCCEFGQRIIDGRVRDSSVADLS